MKHITRALSLLAATLTLLTVSCANHGPAKPYDRSNLARGFTRAEDALADARQSTGEAKDEVRALGSNAKRIDNKSSVILKYWDSAR